MSAPISAIPFGHILCWVDGSDEACRAAERAAHLAKSLGAKLSFLALGDEPGYSKGFEDYAQIEGVIGPMSSSIANNVEACLFQAVSVAADIGVKKAARLVGAGEPASAICDAARTQGADLVVIRRRKFNIVQRLWGVSVRHPPRQMRVCGSVCWIDCEAGEGKSCHRR